MSDAQDILLLLEKVHFTCHQPKGKKMLVATALPERILTGNANSVDCDTVSHQLHKHTYFRYNGSLKSACLFYYIDCSMCQEDNKAIFILSLSNEMIKN